MKTYYYFKTHSGRILIDTFPNEYLYLKEDFEDNGRLILDKKARIGRIKNQHGKVVVLTFEKRFIKRLKFFKEFLSNNLIVLESIESIVETVKTEDSQNTKELIHNLVSLNSYNIQNLHSLIPENVLKKNLTDQEKEVRTIMNEQPNITAKTLLGVIKNNMSMKMEFSVFNKLLLPYPASNKRVRNIRETVLSILYIFINDFQERDITVSLEACDKEIPIDYEAMTVSLFFILENALKYCRQGSQLKIKFQEEDCFCIVFDMISLKIGQNEKDMLCNLNFRGSQAKKIDEKGMGIGMFRVKKTLQLNDAEIIVLPNIDSFEKKNKEIIYHHNQFIIKFPLIRKW